MPTLAEALQKFSQTLPPPPSGESTQPNSDGQTNALILSGEDSSATGPALMPRAEDARKIGAEHGTTTAIAKPKDRGEALRLVREQPDKAAMAAVTSWLPPSVQSWLISLETCPRSHEGKPLLPVTQPVLTAELSEQLRQSLWMLKQTTAPSREQPEQLLELVQTMVTAFKWRTFGGEENVTMNLKVWCEAVGDFPIYAVSKAVRWFVLGSKKEPSIAEFVSDVRLACGYRVMERKRLIEQLPIA
jgi:hypothetical protein